MKSLVLTFAVLFGVLFGSASAIAADPPRRPVANFLFKAPVRTGVKELLADVNSNRKDRVMARMGHKAAAAVEAPMPRAKDCPGGVCPVPKKD